MFLINCIIKHSYNVGWFRYTIILELSLSSSSLSLTPSRCTTSSILCLRNNVTVFSRSYCYTVWSAIGIILLSVCLSVCLWRCALWLSGLVYGAKSYTSVLLASMFLFVPFDTCCRMYRLATKCTTKKRTATWLPIHSNGVSNAASRLVNNDRWHCAVRCDRPPRPVRLCRLQCTCRSRGVRTADLRTQIRSNC